jgi:ABC-type ATPase with predicted acetyltransferase domain
MHEVKFDKEKNRLYVTIGKVDEREEIETVVNKIEEACGELERGFCCLTDLRKYEVRGKEEEPYILMAQKIMVKAGLSHVVRVVKRFGYLAHYQFDKTAIAAGYHAKNVLTIEEAEAILDEIC